MRSQDIRQSFLDFFADRGHRQVPSAPLVPHGDATLLFTNAGMVQFKDYFLGVEKPPGPRAVTAQKCLRVSGKHNDLENVGPSPRHHTFFEMLGNFSFGDYFKAEAIELAFELVTRGWGIPDRHLFASVYEEDEEARRLWLEHSTLPEERIVRCGKKDNFWAMGDTGPCGPCSEIFVDLTPDRPEVPFEQGSVSGRYLEIWNLVFMQYETAADGSRRDLPKPSIDTGSGLERVAAVLQGVESNYDTDLFRPLIDSGARIAGVKYGANPEHDVSLRVIADHIRAVAFLLADGVIPGNEGRGYVLRRVLRRAVRHGHHLGLEEPFLSALLPALHQVMVAAYPELASAYEASQATITAEEEKFLDTVATGARQVQQTIGEIRRAGGQTIPGDQVFRLYDTHGLPIELVREIAEEEQFDIDERGFSTALDAQRKRSRAATSNLQREMTELRSALLGSSDQPATEFLGYDLLESEARLLRLARLHAGEDGAKGGASAVEALEPGDRGVAIFDRTVFYAESGGQVADLGEVVAASGRARVVDVQRDTSGVVFHWLEVTDGSIEVDSESKLIVDGELRRSAERHHTATHLLHGALREHLGAGVRQAGSLVQPERLRFDYTYGRPLDDAQRALLETTVNAWARSAQPVTIEERPYAEAIADGAMALFGEKYGDRVRTVRVPGVSLELCGGCHVGNTGEIGSFVIVGERSVASGVRRIEALAGPAAEVYYRECARRLGRISSVLGTPLDRAETEIEALRSRLREAEKELATTRMKLLSGGNGDNSEESEIGGVKVLVREVPAAPANELRNLADVLRQRLGSGVVLLGARDSGKVNLVAAVTQDLESRINAGHLARSMGDAVGGSGGGRRDFAQAGGKDPGTLGPAFEAARQALDNLLAAPES